MLIYDGDNIKLFNTLKRKVRAHSLEVLVSGFLFLLFCCFEVETNFFRASCFKNIRLVVEYILRETMLY